MILWGTLAQIEHDDSPLHWKSWLLNFTGIVLALYVFMADALRVLNGGEAAVRNVLPKQFNCLLFSVALALMAAPVIRSCRRIWISRRKLSRIGAVIPQ
jgi:hypothetical protein